LADHRRRLTWRDRALDELADFAEHMPTAARAAVDAMERMAEAGWNYGRPVDVDGEAQWYLPVNPLGVFYSDARGELAVLRVVDARFLHELP
jgi:hypothetical protein